ncbi:hypothetical protein SHJG_p272 (plasmid) [Streptomyces hygroscopicus subsp. jinggangensis 5008]|nr:hypothetical protein SHJG_p272 [Streptomyces hygroscopicus subsp. jinggangensis 5008]AGF68541.1 hypothetical protein SHJGH_p272 [Streptomyces hygroscopicus subsp. jinggangensis TL01]
MTSKIPVRGGRKGQQHRATPDDLRSYTVSPASPVTVTRADGSVETRAAKAARKTTPAPRRRGPAVCAMCADPIEGKVWVSRERASRGKPVHPDCEKRAQAFTKERRATKAKERAAKPKRPSLMEENRRLFAEQDRIRELRRKRNQPKK